MKDNNEEVADLFEVALTTNDKDLKLKVSLDLMKHTFSTQKDFFVAIRDLVKDRESLSLEEIKSLKRCMETLISGVNSIDKMFSKILDKQYEIN